MPDNYDTPAFWSNKTEAWHEIMPGVRRRILTHASTGMMVHYKIDAGKTFPRHNHPHAQFGVILEGEGVFNIEGKIWPVNPGDSYYIPPGTLHEFSIVGEGPAIVIDFFTPEREEYVNEAMKPDQK